MARDRWRSCGPRVAVDERHVQPTPRDLRHEGLRKLGCSATTHLDEACALRSANDALTLIAQAAIRQFDEGAFRDMHVYQLPWPLDVLASLGESEVQLRVTQSCFHRADSRSSRLNRRTPATSRTRCGSEVKRPPVSVDEFRKRINQLALAAGEQRPESTGDEGLFFGAGA